ncbi:recombinase RecA, partial [Lactococcus lactis]
KSGAWFAYNDEKICQGAEKAKNYLKEHQEIFDEIDHKVGAAHGLLDEAEVAETTEDTSTKAKATKAKKEEKVVETEEIEL